MDLRANGKRIAAWMPSGSISDYYLASACDEILLPQSAALSLLGLRAEVRFLKNTLALVGVEADLEAIAEYEVAPNTFRRTTMTEPHREMLNGVLDSYYEHVVGAIAEGRGIEPSRVRELIDLMPTGAAVAVEKGLADGLLYEDQLPSYLPARDEAAGEGGAPPVTRMHTFEQASRWLRRPVHAYTRQVIGVVSLEGLIVMGRSRRSPAPLPLPFVQAQAGAETVVQCLRQAEADQRIAAVVLHVETPGGSALASDLIAREVRRLRESKPVVVLMGGQATSGGYYVAACADRIVARPTTITGSIGVWGGKFSLGGLYAKLGIEPESVQRGAMAGLYSETAPFDDEQRARIQRELGETYSRFVALVAKGRSMSPDQVDAVARGRLWTGVQALEVGLVDELGDYEAALQIAKRLGGLDAERDYTVVGVHPGRRQLLPRPYPDESASWQASLNSLRDLARERVWAISPWLVQVEG
jgi:protease-4